MARNLFSVPIFFILFRESLEASIIVSVLLALVEQLVQPQQGKAKAVDSPEATLAGSTVVEDEQFRNSGSVQSAETQKRLLRKLRIQIFAGAATGLLCALAIGAAFIVVFYVKLTDIWAKAEDAWEGAFSLIAAIMIFVMGITMLRMDRAKIKWRLKLQAAFQRDASIQALGDKDVKEGRNSKYALFLLPCITVLREGLEAVVFLGGVSLGQPASSIPIAAIVGLIVGLGIGYLLYKSSSRINISIFLIASTGFLLLIGAGLFSRAVGYLEMYQFVRLVGADVAESGSGPGSYSVHGNIWHLNCCNPEGNNGWSVFNAILGWSNNGSVGTVLAYVFYWLAVIATLLFMRWQEGRMAFFGKRSAAWHRRQNRVHASPSLSSTKDHDKEPETPFLESPTSSGQRGEPSNYVLRDE